MDILDRPELSQRTTLRLGGTAVAEISLAGPDDFNRLPQTLVRTGGTPLVLGQGSNILAKEGRLDLTLIRLPGERAVRVVATKGGHARIAVNAGMKLPALLGWCLRHQLSGLEELAGIPGTVGGAVMMNAGSFGREFGQALHRVRLWDPEKGLHWVEKSRCEFGYRFFHVPGIKAESVIESVELSLRQGKRKEIKQTIQKVFAQKKTSQPIHTRTCGCVFKNPDSGEAAGWLLEKTGMKGYRLGEMGFSGLHANFLINHGRGTADQALELIQRARKKVKETFGIDLELEVRVYPCQ